jgi:hypothetical protein
MTSLVDGLAAEGAYSADVTIASSSQTGSDEAAVTNRSPPGTIQTLCHALTL